MAAEEKNLSAYLGIISKNKGIIFFFTFVCFMTVTAISYLMPDVYRASSLILVDTESQNIFDVRDVVTLGTDYYAYTDYLNTQMEILKSHSIAEQVFNTCNLDNNLNAAFIPETEKSTFLTRMRLKYKEFRRDLFRRLLPVRKPESDEVKHLKKLEAFKQNIKITHQRDTRLIQISYEHQNPKLAAGMVNSITDSYIDYNLKRKINASNEALIWINSEIEKIRSTLKDKENELQKFRDENNLVSAEEKRELLKQSIIDLNEKITEAQITYASYTKKYQIKHPKMQQLMELLTNLNNDFSAKRKEAIE
ncbi:MAG: hypothetical protein JW774_04435, partial [Candidatus Aureabacteria bacterium]|nr:hypothetical protein [Candidatus Auribacterota bacterium]